MDLADSRSCEVEEITPKQREDSGKAKSETFQKRERLRAALCELCGLEAEDFYPSFDMEYSGRTIPTRRGTEDYFLPPKGWIKLALSVANRYEDDRWLSRQEWPVVYHGTTAIAEVVSGIVREGFKIRGGAAKPRNGERCGAGIYCSPLIQTAMRYSDVPLSINGELYTLVFQCRARQGSYSKEGKDVWLVASPEDIRPCGILLFPFGLTDDMRLEYWHENPYTEGSPNWMWYRRLLEAKTVGEARRLGRRGPLLLKDIQKGRASLVGDSACLASSGRIKKTSSAPLPNALTALKTFIGKSLNKVSRATLKSCKHPKDVSKATPKPFKHPKDPCLDRTTKRQRKG